MEWLDKNSVEDLVVAQGKPISEVAALLQYHYPQARGLSEVNVRRFCQKHGISVAKPITDHQLEEEIAKAVAEVGGTCGRRMMTVHFRSKGIFVAERRVGKKLKSAHPGYHANRQKGIQRQLNPVSYHAPFFGYNLHMDQNEKMAEYGVTLVIAVDRCSNFIPSFAVMPRKNNMAIYRDVFSPAVVSFGLWDQIVVDHGKKFYLALFMQHYLRQSSLSLRPPYKQVKSTVNNRVERIWVEINQRIGYPIKYGPIELESDAGISRRDEGWAFAFSRVGIEVVKRGMQSFVQDWNNHTIPGKGAPVGHLERCNTSRQHVPLPSTEDARVLYEGQNSHHLTEEATFGTDAFEHDSASQRDSAFAERPVNEIVQRSFKSHSDIFGSTVNHNYKPLQRAVCLFQEITNEFFN